MGGVTSSELPFEDILRAEDEEVRRSITTDWREEEREERGLVVEARERREPGELGESARGGEIGRGKRGGVQSSDCRRRLRAELGERKESEGAGDQGTEGRGAALG